MNNFNIENDAATVERLSEQRDLIYEGVIDQFRVLMAQDDIDSALALADEFFEWMDPEQLDDEPTFYVNEHDLQQRYLELTQPG